jgi:excisionase family DNA binding protein
MGVEYVTVQEAAAALGLSDRGIRERIERGEMRAVRLGPRMWAIPRDELDRWRGTGRLKPGPKSGSKRKERAYRKSLGEQ